MKFKLTKEGLDGGYSVEILSASLSAADICDMCKAWLNARTEFGRFEKELDELITRHGSFE